MATPPKTTAASQASLRSQIMRVPQWIFDPVDMEHILQHDFELGKKLTAQRLETQAQVHQAIAEGSTKAAKILG